MPRKIHLEKRSSRPVIIGELRGAQPRPRVNFTIDALDYKNINLLKQFVTEQGRILPRKYTGLPAHYQRRLKRAIKRARQMLLLK